MIGEQVESCLDLVFVSGPAWFRAQSDQKGLAERVVGKEPVQIASGDPSIGANAAIRTVGQAQHRPLDARSPRLAEMHLIPPNRHSGRELDARDFAEAFGAGQNGLNLQQSEPRHSLLAPFHAEGIGTGSAQHLIAAAKAEDLPALAVMAKQVDVPTLASQE